VVRYAGSVFDHLLKLSIGEQAVGIWELPQTDGWDDWRSVVLTDVVMAGGEQTLRFTLTQSYALLDYVEFIRHYHPADITKSGQVDMDDFSVLAAQWQVAPGTLSADIAPHGGDGCVDILDLLMLAEYWLAVSEGINTSDIGNYIGGK
jgi:hypothetical protein